MEWSAIRTAKVIVVVGLAESEQRSESVIAVWVVETMIEILTCEIKQCTCGLCGYSWQTLSKNPPSICPSCRSRQWNGKKRTGRPPTERVELTLPSPKRIPITEGM